MARETKPEKARGVQGQAELAAGDRQTKGYRPMLLGDREPEEVLQALGGTEGEVWRRRGPGGDAGPEGLFRGEPGKGEGAGMVLLPYRAFAQRFPVTAKGLAPVLPRPESLLWVAAAWGDAFALPGLLELAGRRRSEACPGLVLGTALPFSAPESAPALFERGFWGAAFCQLWRLRPCIVFLDSPAPSAPRQTAVPFRESYRLSRLLQEGWVALAPAQDGLVLGKPG